MATERTTTSNLVPFAGWGRKRDEDEGRASALMRAAGDRMVRGGKDRVVIW